jgi:hypothetical protein
MRPKFLKNYCLIVIIALLSSCEDGTIGNDADVEQDDIIDESEQSDDAEDYTDALDAMDNVILCFGPGTGGCGDGFICMQQSLPPPTCIDNYNGICTLVPVDCSTYPEHTICTCDTFTPYSNACEAMQAGYGGLLVECP